VLTAKAAAPTLSPGVNLLPGQRGPASPGRGVRPARSSVNATIIHNPISAGRLEVAAATAPAAPQPHHARGRRATMSATLDGVYAPALVAGGTTPARQREPARDVGPLAVRLDDDGGASNPLFAMQARRSFAAVPSAPEDRVAQRPSMVARAGAVGEDARRAAVLMTAAGYGPDGALRR
jgi:hypothetical protein